MSSAGESYGLDAWMVVSKDRREALVTVVRVLCGPNLRGRNLRLRGLDPQGRYVEKDSGFSCSGNALMGLGLPVDLKAGDFAVRQYYMTRQEQI